VQPWSKVAFLRPVVTRRSGLTLAAFFLSTLLAAAGATNIWLHFLGQHDRKVTAASGRW
jgi:hypothetical protein